MLLSSVPLTDIVLCAQLAWLSPTSIAVGSDGINRNEDDRNHLVLCCFLEYSEETFPARPLSDPKTSLSLFESSYIYPPLEPDQSS